MLIKQIRRIVCCFVYFTFVFYCFLLFRILLLRPSGLWDPVTPYFLRLKQYTNLVPFKTLIGYPSKVHLIGNVLLFFPMGMFLPTLWEKARSFGQTVSIIGITVLAVEILQAVLMVGSFDVDDLMMNISGGMLGYLIWRLPPIQKFLRFCGLSEDPAEGAEKR